MNEQAKEEKFLHSIKSELDNQVEDMDAQTLSRLTQIRAAALQDRQAKQPVAWLLPAGALATVCLIFTIVVLIPKQEIGQDSMVEDIDVISDSENLELYEDLEFYEWLEDYV